MKASPFLLTLALSAVVAAGISACLAPRYAAAPQAAKETAYERVIKTGIIRCGYSAWDPMLIIDPQTRKISGVAAETIEAAAAYLNMKVEWSAEYGWSDFMLGLENGQVDVFCAGPTPNAQRARVALFTAPFLYGRFPVYVRADDHRFDGNKNALNQPSVKFGTIDGTTSAKIIAQTFPQASLVSLPETTAISQIFQDLSAHKTDAVIQAASLGKLYDKNNPGKIHVAPGFENVRVLPHVFMVRGGEFRLKAMLDAALNDLENTGVIQDIARKYDPDETAYLMPADNFSSVK